MTRTYIKLNNPMAFGKQTTSSIPQLKTDLVRTKNMSNFLTIGILVLGCLFFFSCGDDYLELTNKNSLTTGNFYKTEQDAKDALTAAYAPLAWRGFFGNSFQFLNFALDDRLIHENPQYELFIFTADDGRVYSLYADLFKGVYRCNMLLQNIDQIPMDAGTKDLYKGQAHFLRGFYYFYLATLFNAPPFIKIATEDPSIRNTNSSQTELYHFVKDELKTAVNQLPWEWNNAEDIGRATKGAALSMLGKTYLYQQNWDSASLFLEQVINEGPYDLMQPPSSGATQKDYLYSYLCNFSPFDLSTPNKNYRAENNVESVFSAQFNDGFSTYGHYWNPGWQNDGSLFSAYFGVNGWRNVVPSASMVNEYESVINHPAGFSKDPRFYASFFSPGDTLDFWYPTQTEYYHKTFVIGLHNLGSISQGYGLKKYCFPIHLANAAAPYQDPNNWRIIRFSDVLLMFAEAEFHLNPSSSKGLEALNRVRSRAGLPSITALSKQAIIHERDCELAFECIRFFDLVRWSIPDENGEVWIHPEELITNYIPGKSEFLPIPSAEINVNAGALKQNPNW